MFCFGTEIGTENRGFSLVSVPNTEILVPWQHYYIVIYFYICSLNFLNALLNMPVVPENKTPFILFVYYVYL